MFTYTVYNFAILQCLLKISFYHYGLKVINIYFNNPIIEYFQKNIIKVQISFKGIIWNLLLKDKSLLSKNMYKIPINYIASVYYEFKSNSYDFT